MLPRFVWRSSANPMSFVVLDFENALPLRSNSGLVT